jgi:hypothetical protein
MSMKLSGTGVLLSIAISLWPSAAGAFQPITSAPDMPPLQATWPNTPAAPNLAPIDVAALKAKAEKGDTLAQTNLGQLYSNGGFIAGGSFQQNDAVKKDSAEAMKWFRMAADQGDAAAQEYIGNMYEHGNEAVKQDWPEAFFWYRLAAEQRYEGTAHRVSPADVSAAEAAKQLTPEQRAAVDKRIEAWDLEAQIKAGNQGDGKAQRGLGNMYRMGLGVKQDYAEAYFWLSLALKTPYGSPFWRDDVARQLPPEQKAAVDKRVEDWMKSHPAPLHLP